MRSGQNIEVINYDGKLLKRKVVDVFGEVVLICKPEEYETAMQHRSLPWCVGFRKERIKTAETQSSKAKSV